MNNNCQEYDFSVESLLLSCNKLFHFLSKGYRHNVPSNQTFKITLLVSTDLIKVE